MKIAIMQPYLFPYIGYWQLINAVDNFVIYDDVSFIKQGYINRNNILGRAGAQVFTLELKGASSNRLIKDIEVGGNNIKIIKTIKQNYSKAPFYREVMPLIEEILNNSEKNLAIYIGYSLKKIAQYLKIDTNFIYSSQINKNLNLRSQDKVVEICNKLKTSCYINAIGGQELYSKEIFKKHSIELNFIDTKLLPYRQFKGEFTPYLSIIDLMMFNDIGAINEHLESYKII